MRALFTMSGGTAVAFVSEEGGVDNIWIQPSMVLEDIRLRILKGWGTLGDIGEFPHLWGHGLP